MIGVGDVFGRLVVQAVADPGPPPRKRPRWVVFCDPLRGGCGKQKVVLDNNLQSGHTTSCGCFRIERVRKAQTTHGHLTGGNSSPEYEAWRSMLARCYDRKCDSYKHYGGKGATVVPAWRESFEAFLRDVGPRPSNDHVIGRRREDKDKPFGPGTALWLTHKESSRERADNTFFTVGNKTMCLVDWAREYKIPKSTLHYRVMTKGMDMRNALDVGAGRSGKCLPT